MQSIQEKSPNDQNKYTLRVLRDSMYPLISDGDRVCVDPDHEALPGHLVVVYLTNGEGAVLRRYLRKQKGAIVLEAVNPAYDNITLKLRDIKAMHCVVSITHIEDMSKYNI